MYIVTLASFFLLLFGTAFCTFNFFATLILLIRRNNEITINRQTVKFSNLFSYLFLTFISCFITYGVYTRYINGLNTSNFFDEIFWSIILILSSLILLYAYILFKNTKNYLNTEDDRIYVRDINVDYSPAILSFLVNQKIEVKKDIASNILNISSKGFIKIGVDENNNTKLIPCESNETLTPDEKYLFDCIFKSDEKFSLSKWSSIIQEEYDKLNFSKKNKSTINSLFEILLVLIIVIVAILSIFIVLKVAVGFDMNIDLLDICFKLVNIVSAIPLFYVIILYAKSFIEDRIIKKDPYFESIDINRKLYTLKGLKELKQWIKFKKFIINFSLIKQADFKSVMIWKKYLSYSMALDINKDYNDNFFDTINNTLNVDFNNIIKNIFYID